MMWPLWLLRMTQTKLQANYFSTINLLRRIDVLVLLTNAKTIEAQLLLMD